MKITDPGILEVNGRTLPFTALKIDISPLSLIDWLEAQKIFPKVYWEEREGNIQRAALGNILQFSQFPVISPHSSPDARFFGGKEFNRETNDPLWDSFPSCSFWLPQFEMIQDNERTVLQINQLSSEPNSNSLSALVFDIPQKESTFYDFENRLDLPSFEQWTQQIHLALDLMNQGLLNKVVLARQSQFSSTTPFSPLDLLKSLKQKVRRATLFAFQINASTAFIGATPEMLYKRHQNTIKIDALAGTAPCNAGDLLLSSPKEMKEFTYVKEFISDKMNPLCIKMDWEPKDRMLSTSYTQHIYNSLTATLKPLTSDRILIETLHPTPALGGVPRMQALTFLEEHEPFSRGWYGSPIGWITSQEANIAVAIRSALIKDKQLTLFAGAGIVQGSEPDKEWEELEQKITPFKQVIACTQAGV